VQGHLDAEGDGIWLVFLAVDDVATNARLMARRGLATQAVGTTARITAAGLRLSSTTPRPGALSPPLGEAAAKCRSGRSPSAARATVAWGSRTSMARLMTPPRLPRSTGP
jgi:hypothetical protein